MASIRWSGAASLVLGAAIARLLAADQSPAPQIAAEIQRIAREWKAASDDPFIKNVAGSSQASLKAADDSLRSGRIYLALESLAQAVDLLNGAQVVVEKTATVGSGMPAFESEWGKASQRLAALTRQVRARKWDGSPAALRALSETSLGKSAPLLDGGRGFALANGPKDGLFYLGEARGQAEFAKFCGSLPLARAKRAWAARSLLPELLALQGKADAAFQPPRSIEQHPRFIALNSTIKLARELDSSKSYYGAMYQYLEAVRHYGMLDAAPLDAARQAELRSAIEAGRRKLEGSERDDSLVQLFLERAAAQTAHAGGAAPSADEWRSAQVIVSQVLPAYAAALTAAPPVQQTAGKTIDVTLVRWPYT
jgi:hypothetical protein